MLAVKGFKATLHFAAGQLRGRLYGGGTSFSLTPRPSLEKASYRKYDLLLVFQKRRFCVGTKSKCQFDNEGPQSKTAMLNMTWFLYSKIKLYMTLAVKVINITVRLRVQ